MFALIYKPPIKVEILKEFNKKKSKNSDDSDLSFEDADEMKLKVQIYMKSMGDAERSFN